jgi:hypothetical protein
MADLVGRQLGNWKLLRLLGEGGFGQVYEAENVATTLRAAVKILTASGPTAEVARAGFLKEARAANAAKHDGVVQVYDAGESPDGLLYMVMELLTGTTLSEALARAPEGRLPWLRAAKLGVRVSSALAAVHGTGVVHRDLKPDNLFLLEKPQDPEAVKILDFGIAKLRSTLATQGPPRIMGTPPFMAPEQWRAAPDIDGRADIYSLGNILFRMTTGRLPFAAETLEQWMYAHLETEPMDPRQLAPMPAQLAELISRMLSKDPAARPRDMAEVANELEKCIEVRGTEVAAPQVAARPEPRRWLPMRRRRGLALAAVIAVGLSVTALLHERELRRDAESCRQAIRVRDWKAAATTCLGAAGRDPSLVADGQRAQRELHAEETARRFSELLRTDPNAASELWRSIVPGTGGAASAARDRSAYLHQHRQAAAQAMRLAPAERCERVKQELALVAAFDPDAHDDKLLETACASPRTNAPVKAPAARLTGHGWITVMTDPADAQVYLDDERRCRTQAGLGCVVEHLTSGRYHIEIRKDGYQPFSQMLSVSDGFEQPLQVKLTRCPAPPAPCQ